MKKDIKYGVSRRALLITAGIVWLIAGANVFRIGVDTWMDNTHEWMFRFAEATAIFLLFFQFVFKRLYDKYTRRIDNKKERNCPLSFFDVKGWVVMIVMISFGVLARKHHWFSDSFIAVFYTGLSVALMVTGILFLRHAHKKGISKPE